MSKVFFASSYAYEMGADHTLPMKLDRVLKKLDFSERMKDKKVCIKMHLGGNVGYSTIHPIFVRRLVDFVKKAGGKPFVTEIDYFALSAHERGYTQEVLGCPVLPAAGFSDKYYHEYPLQYKNLSSVQIAGEVWDADFLICLSHAKGHGCTGYGGAIKNLAIGALTNKSRSQMHMVQHAEKFWDAEKCTHYIDGCSICVEQCPRCTTRFADDKTLHVGFHECDFCKSCNDICPTGALSITDVNADDFQEAMARVVQAILGNYPDENSVFLNIATNITPFCDCMGMTTPSLVPDIGIFASRDIVAIENATLDSIKYENLIPGSMIGGVKMLDLEGHLFKKIHGVDPYTQVRASEELGLGTGTYEIEEVR
ncbi:MAG TPA: DUF362 domain-containing protein [Armatimonadota bacterium]